MTGIDLLAAQTNSEKATEGVWVNFAVDAVGFVWWLDGEPCPVPEGTPTARARIARAGNPRSRELRKRLMRPYQQLIRRGGELPEEVVEKITHRVLAETILLDWSGITENGQPVPYSPENALRYIEASEDFRLFVLEVSGTTQVYRDQQLKEDAELLGNSSTGSSRGDRGSKSSAPRAQS